jgi:hypothetical protein
MGVIRCCKSQENYEALDSFFETAGITKEGSDIVAGLLPNGDQPGFDTISEPVLKKLFDVDAASPRLTYLLFRKLNSLGKSDAAMAVQRRNAQASYTDKRDLSEQIKAIDPAPKISSVPPRQEEFWNKCGRPFGGLNEWMTQATWNLEAAKLLNNFVLPKGLDREFVTQQVLDIVAPVDFSLFDELLEKKKGLVIAASHVGSVLGQAVVLNSYSNEFRIIGGSPRERATSTREDIFMTGNPRAAVRKILQSLAQNEVLACAPDDVPQNVAKRFFESEFGPLPVQTLYAVSIHATNSPSVSSNIFWENGKLNFHFQKLPEPQRDEPRSEFVDRWCSAYLDHLIHNIKTRLPDLNFAHTLAMHSESQGSQLLA